MNDKTVKFQNKLNARYNNEYLVLGEYINQDTKIKVKHKKCNNEFYINPKNFRIVSESFSNTINLY